MIEHEVRVHPSADRLAREEQLAWKLAEVATDPVDVDDEVAEMIVNRVIDDAAVAAAALFAPPGRRGPCPGPPAPVRAGATVLGLPPAARVSPEWAAWANGVAVRELDFHDTFLAAEYSHPGDNIPPLLAVAQHRGRSRRTTSCAPSRPPTRSRSTWPGRSRLHAHKIDHVAHLGPSVAAGLGSLLELSTPRSSTRRSNRRSTSPRRPGSPARARSPAGRPTRRPSPSKMADRGGRPGDARRDGALARSTRARTA